MKNDELMRKFAELRKELAQTGLICTGSVLSVFHKCGRPGCACATDKNALHGPYLRWTRKVASKTVTRNLTDHQAELCREYIQNYRRVEEILEEMKKLSVLYIESQR
ncbi:MAG: DUF6788 family protein [Spirochaetia bacterium]|jgi:hypothetical protein